MLACQIVTGGKDIHSVLKYVSFGLPMKLYYKENANFTNHTRAISRCTAARSGENTKEITNNKQKNQQLPTCEKKHRKELN